MELISFSDNWIMSGDKSEDDEIACDKDLFNWTSTNA
jgi:hypothetical protein